VAAHGDLSGLGEVRENLRRADRGSRDALGMIAVKA